MISKATKKNAEKTAAYIRASSDKQMAASPTRQRGDCTEIAKRFDLPSPSDWYVESAGRSGLKRKGRAALAQLLVDAQDGKFDYLVISEASRMSREKLKHQFELFQRITETGVRIFSDAGEIDLDDFASWMQYSFEGYKAREEAGRLGKRVVSGIRTKLGLTQEERDPEYLLRAYPGFVKRYYRDGKLIHTTRYSDPPKSFIKPPGAVCKLEITDDLEELEAVREVFDILASGQNSQVACEAFNNRGMKTKNGNPWTPQEIRRLVRRRQFVGQMVYGQRTTAEFNKVTDGPTVFDDICPRLIDQRIYDEAIATLDALKTNMGRKSRFPKYMLSGLLVTPTGRKMFGRVVSGKPTYSDSGTDERFPRDADEGYLQIRCELIDNAVLAALRSHLLNPQNLEVIQKELIKEARLTDAVSDPTIAELNAVTEKLNQVAENAMYATHAKLLERMQEEMQKLEQRQEELQQHIERKEERKKRSAEVADLLAKLPRALGEPNPELSEIFAGLIRQLEISHDGLGWIARIDFAEGGSIHLDDRDINGHMECHKTADVLMEKGEATTRELAEAVGIGVSAVNIRLKRAIQRGRPIVKKAKGVWVYDCSQGGGNSLPVCVANVQVCESHVAFAIQAIRAASCGRVSA